MNTAAPIAVDVDLVRSLDAGDESALDRTLGELARGVAPAVLLSAVKALLRCGLPALATELLGTIGRPLLAEPSLAALAARLASMPGDRVPKNLQSEHAQRNCAAIEAIGTRIPAAVAPWLASDQIDVLRDVKHRCHAVVRDSEQGLRLVSALRLTLRTEERTTIETGWPPSFATAGLPPPHMVTAMFDVQAGSRLPRKFIAFENDPMAIASWLRSGDFTADVTSRRLECRFDDDGPDAYLASIVGRSDVPPIVASIVVRPESGLRGAVQRLPGEWAARWIDERSRLAAEATARYRGRGATYWLSRYRAAKAGHASLRVLGIASRHTQVVRHMMRDLLAAMEDQGHSVALVTEPDDSMPTVDSIAPFTREDADLVIAMNYLRAYPQMLVPVELPFVSWMQDAVGPAQSTAAGRAQGPLDLLVTQSPGFWESCFSYPRGQSLAAANLTSWRLYGRVGDERRQTEAPDVVYIGHGWEDVATLNATTAKTPMAITILTEITDEIRRRLAAADPPNGFERMRIEADVLCRHSVQPSASGSTVYWACTSAFDRLFRHEMLEWAARWAASRGRTFAIYGEGWHQHPTLGQYARGPIANGRALAELCRDAGAVLHANGNASLHQRLLDGLAAGGCVLTRRNPADELPQHHRALASLLGERGITDLRSALCAAEADERLRTAIDGIERTLGCAVAPTGDPRRDADIRVIRATTFWPEETLTDDGFLRQLIHERGIMTPDGAADIDGFAAASFAREHELHALLDLVTSDDEARSTLAAPMRRSVKARFTMESLVNSIITSMTEMLERAAR